MVTYSILNRFSQFKKVKMVRKTTAVRCHRPCLSFFPCWQKQSGDQNNKKNSYCGHFFTTAGGSEKGCQVIGYVSTSQNLDEEELSFLFTQA